MSSIQIKKMKWFKPVSAWEHTQRWKAKRAEMRADFEERSTDLINRLTAAQNNLISGTVENTSQKLATRVQKELAAKIEQVAASKTNILA